MPSYQELLAQREQLDKQIKEAVQREKADGIAKAKVIIEQYGLNAADLFSRKAGSTRGPSGKVAPKYRDPANAANTWTGRGRMPQWVQALHSAGTLASAEIKTAE